ncbi:hypothetical protein, partial [Plasmodium yoelii yoelii]
INSISIYKYHKIYRSPSSN